MPRRSERLWLLAAAVTAGAALIGLGPGGGAPVALAAPGLAAIAWTDQRAHRIPNRLLAGTAGALAAAALLVTALGGGHLGPATWSGLVWVSGLLAAHLAEPRGLGFGDVKLGGPLGFLLGWTTGAAGLGTIGALITSAVVFAVGGTATALTGRARRGEATPLAPGLVGATFAAVAVLAATA